MVERDAVTVGVRREVVESKWRGFGDEEPEDTPARGARTDQCLLVVSQSDGEELVESGSRLVQHPERAVTGVDQGTGLFDKVAQEDLKLNVGLDHEDCVQETT
jgi:hypothetical protein